MSSNDLNLNIFKAQKLLNAGEYQKAIEYLNVVIDENPLYEQAYYLVAKANFLVKNYDEALSKYLKAFHLFAVMFAKKRKKDPVYIQQEKLFTKSSGVSYDRNPPEFICQFYHHITHHFGVCFLMTNRGERFYSEFKSSFDIDVELKLYERTLKGDQIFPVKGFLNYCYSVGVYGLDTLIRWFEVNGITDEETLIILSEYDVKKSESEAA